MKAGGSSLDVQRQLKLVKKEVMRLDTFLNRIQMGSGVTDASGDATISFPNPYPSTPFVFLQAVDAAARGIVLDVVSKSATEFTVKAYKVTGLPTAQAVHTVLYEANTGSGGVSHTHTYSGSGTTGGPSTTATPVDNVLYAANTGGHNSATQSGVRATGYSETKYAASTSGGSPTFPFTALYTTAPSYDFLTGAHTHPMGLITVDRVTVASSTHTHGFSWSGTTSTESASLHTHPTGAITVVRSAFVSGDPAALSVDFDYLALLR